MAGILKTVSPYGRGAGHYCVGELNYERANEEVTLGPVASNPIKAGQILGKLTTGGNYVAYAPAASDGSQNFAGILWDDRPVNAAAQPATVTVREATVNQNALVGFSALTTPQKTALVTAAKAMGIIILP